MLAVVNLVMLFMQLFITLLPSAPLSEIILEVILAVAVIAVILDWMQPQALLTLDEFV